MTLLTTIVAIGFLIFVHELGHLIAARAVGIPVARFSLGFGPVLWKRRYGGVEYCFSMIPLGGYVLPECESEEAFFAIAPGRRIVMWLGGPLANFVLAAILLAIGNAAAGQWSLSDLLVEPWLAVARGSINLLAVLPTIFLHPDGLSGIIGIVAAGKSSVAGGLASSLRFFVLLNLNLAVFNLLPLPPLDGGKIICCLLEKVHPRLAILHVRFAVVGLAVLLLLVAYTTVLDVMRQLA
jgi:regulator of sigma E protease